MADNVQLTYKPDFEEAKQHWLAFWEKQILDRPCVILSAPKNKNVIDAPYVCAIEDDLDAVLNQAEQFFLTHHFLADYIPGFRPAFGPDQMAGFMGAPIQISPDRSTSWSKKVVEDWRDFPLRIDTNSKCWQRMIEYHQKAELKFSGKCLIYNIDLHSNIDCLEGLRGAQKLLFDIIDTPELVLKAMSNVRQLYKIIFEAFYKYGQHDIYGTCPFMKMYSSGKTNPVQADFICLLSPDMFREFVLPAIIEEIEYLDHSCFHLDGVDSLKHLSDILAIEKLNAVQWVPGAGQKPQLEWPEVLHRIQDAGKSIILYGTCEQIKAIHRDYDPSLVVYDVKADSYDQAQEFLNWLMKNT